MIDVLTNLIAVIISQYIYIKSSLVHLKIALCYMSITSQGSLTKKENFKTKHRLG